MIDLHCHILPGIDDGAENIKETVRMAELAARDHIHTIVATPHITKFLPNSMEQIKEKVQQVNNVLTANAIPVTIITGGEIFSDQAEECLSATIGSTSYILVEFPMSYLPASTWNDITLLIDHGLRPIIAHPERNVAILHNPNLLFDLLGDNISVQVTAGSLTGEFGPSVRECAFYLLQQGIVDFIASDAHSTIHRIPQLSVAVNKAARIVGKDRATAMVTKNPQLVLDNKILER
ncbi:MAG: hypothetical protein OEM02_02610 [Desulfobulbaceae bacterium]|nr:hypothetical protein [Desulfobulbaceae bacterium]